MLQESRTNDVLRIEREYLWLGRGKSMNQSEQKETIKQIRQRYHLTAQRVAEMASVPLRVEYLMEIGCPVSKKDAEKVMQALSALTGDRFTLLDVTINVK